jgi:hypothetical protein
MAFIDFIFEFAYEQKDALARIEDQIPQLSAHLIKVLIFVDDVNQNHWQKEILSYIDIIDNVCDTKTKSGRISAKTLHKTLKNTLEDRYFEKIIKKLSRDYDIKLSPVNKVSLFGALREFYENLFNWLEKDFVDDSKILNLVEKLKLNF